MADNIKLYQEINDLLKTRSEMLEKHTKELSKQVIVAQSLKKAIEGASYKEILDDMEKLSLTLEEVAEKAVDAGNKQVNASKEAAAATKDATKALGEMSKKGTASKKMLDRIGIGLGILSASLLEFHQAFASQFKSLINLSKAVGTGIFNITKSLVALPFKLMESLVDEAFNWWERVREAAIATEEVRKQFGDLASNEGKAVVDSFRSASGQLANTNLSLGQVFNTMDNNAEVIRYFNELATGMGPIFTNLKDQIAANAEAMIVYQKGLGLTSETMGAIGQRASAMGKTITDELREITNYSVKMGKRFNISSKLISRDLGEMAKQADIFGSVGKDAMVGLSVFSKKLGVDFKQLLGVVQKFDDFEGAADSVAKLSQAFGMNLDAYDMMMDQDPASRVDKIRKSFAETGRSFETMSRQERNHLAELAGVDATIADQVFGMKNLNMSYTDILKSAKASGKIQMTQEEATRSIASNIERVVVSIERAKNFFDMFLRGITFGILRSEQFTELLSKTYKALTDIFWAGSQVGRSIFEIFQITKEGGKSTTIFSGLLKVMQRISKAAQFIPDLFKQFFQKIKEGGSEARGAIGTLLIQLKEEFLGNTGLGAIFEDEGVKMIASAVGNIFGSVGSLFREKLKDLAVWLKNDGLRGLINDIRSKSSDASSFAGRLFGPIFEELRALWEDKEFRKNMKEGLSKAFEVIFEELKPVLKQIALPVFVWLFGPAALKGAFSLIGNTAIATSGYFFKALIEGGATQGLEAAMSGDKLAAVGSRLTSFLANPYVLGAAAAVAIGAAGFAVAKEYDKYEATLKDKFKGTQLKIAAASGSIIETLSFGQIPQPVIETIAESIGKAFKEAIDLVKEKFGNVFGETIEDMIGNEISIFKGVGDVLIGIFEGDSSKIADGLQNILLGASKNILNWVFGLLPKILTGIYGAISNLLGGIVEFAMTTIGEYFTYIPRMLGDLTIKFGDWLRSFDNGFVKALGRFVWEVGHFIKGTFTLIKDLFNVIGQTASALLNGVSEGAKLVGNVISTLFSAITELASGSTDLAMKKFMSITDITDNAIANIGKGFLKIGKDDKALAKEEEKTTEQRIANAQAVAAAKEKTFSMVEDSSAGSSVEVEAKVDNSNMRKANNDIMFDIKKKIDNINLNINLKLSIDADTLSHALADTGILLKSED